MATSIDTMAADNINRNNVAASALEQTFGQLQKVSDAAIAVTQGAATDAQLVRRTEAMASAEASKRTADFSMAIGTNPDAANYALEKLVDQANKGFEAQRANADRITNALTPQNIVKDPLQYIADVVMFDWNQMKQKALDSSVASTVNQIQTLNNSTQEHRQTMNAIAQPVTTESALASARVAKAEVDIKVGQLQIDSLRTNAEGVTKVAALKNSNMDIALRARDQQLQEQQIAIARQNAALSAQSLSLQIEDRKDARQLKQEQLATRTNMLAAVNAGREINGGLPAFRTFEEMQATMELDPKQKEFILSQYNAGMTAAQTGAATIGKDPYSTIKYIAGTNAVISDGRTKVLGFLDKVKGAVANDPKLVSTIKKESDLASAINNSALSAANSMLKNVSSGANNIYSPPPLAAMVQDPEFSKTYTAQKIMAPMVAGGVTDTNLKGVVGMVIEAARKGTIPQAQADNEIGFLANKIMGYNNELYRYNATAGLPNMKSVNVPMDDNSSFQNATNNTFGPGGVGANTSIARTMTGLLGGNNEVIVDLANPVKRSEYINKKMAQSIPPVLRQQAAKTTKLGAP